MTTTSSSVDTGSADEQPLITIGITCHNAASTIERAVSSALAQDWPNLEILIVDDCSEDDSVRLVAKAIAGDPRARLLRHANNGGVAASRNTILENARGELIAFFDDDDVSSVDRVSAQWKRILTYQRVTGVDLLLCYSDRSVIEIGESGPSHQGLAVGRCGPEPRGRDVADFLLGLRLAPAQKGYVWGLCGSCTLMARRETLLAVGGFDPTFRRCAEIDVAVRAAFMGAHFIAVDRPLVTQYKTWGAEKAGKLPLVYTLKLCEKHRDYLISRHSYLASRAFISSNFYQNQGEVWKSRLYRIIGWLLSPRVLSSTLKMRAFALANGKLNW